MDYGNTWGVSLEGYGRVNFGIDAIKQRIIVAVLTVKGTDPFRPTFGTNIYDLLDSPVNVAVPLLNLQILQAVSRWVPEVQVVRLDHSISEGVLEFSLTFTVPGFDGLQTVSIPTAKYGVSGRILKSKVPNSDSGNNYILHFIHNGLQVQPLPPDYGFKSIADTFSFCQVNYPSYGEWFYTGEVIGVRMKSDTTQDSWLNVKVERITPFPLSDIGYQVLYAPFNGQIEPDPMPVLLNEDEVLAWANENWAQYGWWGLRYRVPEDGFFFSDDFSIEFERQIGDKVLRFQPLEGNEGVVNIEGY